ncbi:30S ribosome-binding factor RbfA [Anaerovorax odorimutans]|uniref:30S ribosome-binding factor RbfA n=1 Tax=Anaerovorax odorimutans TaxID=109327 RepID=UPI00040A4693|nr:30S ribosome-binding factor RbfA [Anaerovorax odorimutans]
MGKGYRAGRLGEEIRKITSDLLLREIKDPRLTKSMVSISAVDVTEDGSYATLYITALGLNAKDEVSSEEKDNVINALKSAKGLIRKEIGKKVKLRHVPDLLFKFDTSQEYGRHISKLIDELGIEKTVKEDEE